jgi:hypothetical protein
VKIYYAAAALEALRKKERGGEQLKQDETQFTTKNGAFFLVSPPFED